MSSFHLLIKPCGPTCNLACTYCYYRSKDGMFPDGDLIMSERTLETLVRQYIEAQDGGVATFAWQGGEPTLLGLDFFRRAIGLQERYRRPGMMIENTIQTNGTLLDEEWCRFLHDHGFLVGLSVDGPAPLHDLHRRDKRGGSTMDKVLRAARMLRRHHVEFNTLTVVNRDNARCPKQVYRFLRNIVGSRYMQFIPCVEPKGFEDTAPQGWSKGKLPHIDGPDARPGTDSSFVTEWSVDPEDYGSFMNGVFDEWARADIGRVYVINFEVALGSWMGLPPSACTFAETCGNALAIEHDGSVYSCDHYVYPEHRLGTIHESDLIDMVSSERQIRFGGFKAASLPVHCRECEVLAMCRGECPRNRFLRAPNGEEGVNFLCKGLRNHFIHIRPWLTLMAREIQAGREAKNVMKMFNTNMGTPRSTSLSPIRP